MQTTMTRPQSAPSDQDLPVPERRDSISADGPDGTWLPVRGDELQGRVGSNRPGAATRTPARPAATTAWALATACSTGRDGLKIGLAGSSTGSTHLLRRRGPPQIQPARLAERQHANGTCAIPLNNAMQTGQPGYNNPGAGERLVPQPPLERRVSAWRGSVSTSAVGRHQRLPAWPPPGRRDASERKLLSALGSRLSANP